MTDAPTPNDAPQTPPGWYPVDGVSQRYWDGAQWTAHTAPLNPAAVPPPPGAGAAASSDDHTMGMLAHLLGLFTGFLGPLIIFLAKKDSPFVRHHAAEALNFQITVFLAIIASVILILAIVGLILLPVVAIGALVMEIMGAVAANRGEWWRYPVNIRFVK